MLKLAVIIASMAFMTLGNAQVCYNAAEERSQEEANAFANMKLTAGRYLIFRDLYSLMDRHVQGDKVLDYGTGTGYCINVLKKYGLAVTGVDISEEMLKKARLNYPDTPFHLVSNGSLPFEEGRFDVIFSSFVLLEINSEKGLVAYLEEAKRVMKENGVFIGITSSQDRYSKEWLFEEVDFPENKNLTSGCKIKLYSKDAGIVFEDYYWTEEDYKKFFSKAGFQIVEIYYPLGKESDPYPWKDELYYSPYVILVAKRDLSPQ